jgi:glycosyltransferase involved in cell wall biosynthesis
LSTVTSRDTQSDQLTILRPAGADASSTPVRSTTALTVILPCYNEAERLPQTLQALLAYLSGIPGQVEVLVVDDGSTDATVMAADAVAAVDRRVRVLSHQPNRGKGFAVRTGMLAAEGELIVFTDADGSYGPSDVDRIVRALARAPVAIGARTSGTSRQVARRTASRVFNLAIRSSLGLPFGDTQSGLKGFRRAAARQIFSQTRVDGFAFDVEVLWLARQLKLDVAEVAVQAMERQGSKVRMLADALGMLREVRAIGRVRTNGASVDVGKASNPPSHEEATGGADLPLTAATTPPALQAVS